MTDVINVGSTDNDGNGDTLRAAFSQINTRFNELLSTIDGGDAWATGVTYTATPIRQWVIESGQAYVAAVNHVSGASFAADLSAGKWFAVDSAQILADLAAPTGSSMVGHIASGTGAVATTVQDQLRELLNANHFGADPTGSTDSTSAFNLAATQALAAEQTLVASGAFKISGAVNLRNVRCDFSSATILLDSGAGSFVIGGNSNVKTNPKQSFKKITRSGGVTATPTVRIAGSKDQCIEIDNVDYLQVYADATVAPTTDGSIGYCTVRLGYVDKLELYGADSASWVNENNFYLQRCQELILSGAYQHNHNHFCGGAFETGTPITFNVGKDNYVHNARFEGGATVTFASGTERNTVINTWDSSRVSFDQPGVTVVDNGFDNAVMDDFSLYRYSDTVAYTDISSWVPDTQTSPRTPRYSHLQRIATASATVDIIQSGFVAINAGDVFRWVTVSNTGGIDDAACTYRAKIYFYDAKMMPITASADFIYAPVGAMLSLSDNSIRSNTNTAKSAVWILPAAITAGVRFVKVSWLGVGGTSAVQMFVTHFTQFQNTYKGIAGQVIQPNAILVSGIPTQCYAEAGATCIKSDGSAKYLNKFAAESSLTTAAAGGATAVVIAALAGTAIGDVVGINLDNGDTYWTTVSARTNTEITLTAPIPSPVATVSVSTGGSGFTNGELVNITAVDGTGTGATGTATVVAGAVTAVAVVSGGSNYTNSEAVNIVAQDGSGTGATGTVSKVLNNAAIGSRVVFNRWAAY